MMKKCLLIAVVAAGLFLATASGAETTFAQPMLVTTAGQSVDVKLAGVLLDRLKVAYKPNPAATAADLAGIKTLLIVPGYSSKGLGSAGVSREDELNRVRSLLAAAKAAGIPVLALHLGGKARRGVQSDDFNQLVVEASSLLIVVEQGNEDGFFTQLCQDKQIALKVVKSMAEAMKPLEEVIAK
jgi:hypothetical protein